MPSRLAPSLRPFRAVAANADLRRVAIAFAGFAVTEYGVWIALLVVAYERGGAAAVGVVGVVQLLPAALVAPFAATLADRYRRERVLSIGYLVQVVALAATAAALVGNTPFVVVSALAAIASAASTATRPAQAALLPELARTAEELTAAGVAVGAIESLGLFAGPAAAGALLAAAGPSAVFAGMAALVLGAAVLTAGIAPRPAQRLAVATGGDTGVVGGLLGGVRAAVREPAPRLVVGILSAHAAVRGALDVLVVLVAFRLLDTAGGGAALLNAAYGIGAVLGAAGAVLLVGRQRLAPALLGGAVAWLIALGAVGLVPRQATAPTLLALAGVGRTLIEVAGRLLLLRAVPDRVLARVFGLLEGASLLGLAVGLVLAPPLAAALGGRAALVVVGAVLPALVVVGWPRLVTMDASAVVPVAELRLLRGVPIFAPLSAPVLERLAGRLIAVALPAGTTVIREGDRGDRFYVLAAGEVAVSITGHPLAAIGAGGFFGEIALLRDVPRTATVTARTNVRLYALERDDFLAAVTGHAMAVAEADTVIRRRLDEQVERERAERATRG